MKKYFQKIFAQCRQYRKQFALLLFSMVILLITNYFLPFLSRDLIDNGFLQKDVHRIVYYVGLILLLHLVSSAVTILKNRSSMRIFLNIRTALEKDAFRHLLNVRMDYFQTENATSAFQTIQEDITQISSLFSADTVGALTAVFSAVGGGIALFIIDWRLGAAVVGFTPVIILCTHFFSRRYRELIRRTITARKQYSNWFGEAISGVRDIRLFGLQAQKSAEMETQVTELKKLQYQARMTASYNGQLQSILTEVLKAGVYVLAALILTKGSLTVGSIIAFQSYMMMVANSETIVLQLFFGLFALFPNIRRYYDFMDEPEEDGSDLIPSAQVDALDFRDVSFAYDSHKDILNHVDLSFPCRSKIALVGENGAGKTTFLNLMLRLLEPQDGAIRLNGEDVSSYQLDEYRKLFSVVSQDVFLFHNSIRYNICLEKDVPEDLLDLVIRRVHLDGVIRQYGMDYVVGENGAKLSGGQKQKIALARAIIQQRPILLFDEATSNLDKNSIRNFIALFDDLIKETTVFCVTHSDEIASLFDYRLEISNGSASLRQNR